MVKFYDTINKSQQTIPKLYMFQKQMKDMTQMIKERVGQRGQMQQREIDLCSKTALFNIETALKEITVEELKNPD